MKYIKCLKCGRYVPPTSKKCPHCGSTNPNTSGGILKRLINKFLRRLH